MKDSWEYAGSLRVVLKSELSATNRITAVASLVVPVLSCRDLVELI
jgi:hypothetical protein